VQSEKNDKGQPKKEEKSEKKGKGQPQKEGNTGKRKREESDEEEHLKADRVKRQKK